MKSTLPLLYALLTLAACSAPSGDPATPPGGEIVFISDEGGVEDLYGMDVGTGERRRITVTDSVAGETRGSWAPAWSPDHERIVFASNRDDGGASNLYVVDRDGSNLARLTDHDGYDYAPEFSPDGRRIAFLSNRDGAHDLYTMAADGTDVRRLTELAEAPGRLCCPDWHPDGTRIAFMIRVGGYFPTIWTVGAGGSDARQVMASAGLPRWSPDGTRLAYITSGFQVAVADSGGTDPLPITSLDGTAMYPAWSPDGSRIVFSYLPREDSTSDGVELYWVALDGSEPVRLTENRVMDSQANWW